MYNYYLNYYLFYFLVFYNGLTYFLFLSFGDSNIHFDIPVKNNLLFDINLYFYHNLQENCNTS